MDTYFSHQHLEPGITGLVLTMNGERLLERCLVSLAFCSRLLLVDSGSTDTTESIAARFGAEFVPHPWQGFDKQFSYAQTLVRTRWFFILDQDEICAPALAARIVAAVAEADDGRAGAKEPVAAFSVGRRSWYFDRFITHAGWYPDPIPRVFRTGQVEFYQDAHIHYRPLGPTLHLEGARAEIVHYPYSDFSHHLSKINMYADQGAESLRAQGKPGGIMRGVGHGLARFVRIYFFKRGFLDGRAGFILACHGSFYAFLKYVRVLDASWGAPYNDKNTST